MPQNWFKLTFWKIWNINESGGKNFYRSLSSWDFHGAIVETIEKQKLIQLPANLSSWEKCRYLWFDYSQFAIKVQQ